MSIIKTENICKNFGTLEVLKNVSLTVEQGEVICIIGPSGAGKSTYLRSLNHLEKITSGEIYIEDKLLDDRVNGVNKVKITSKERAAALLEMGMVFQRFNLFPHKTCTRKCYDFPINVKKLGKEEAKEKATELLIRVGLGDKLDSYPSKTFRRTAAACCYCKGFGDGPKLCFLMSHSASALDLNLLRKF